MRTNSMDKLKFSNEIDYVRMYLHNELVIMSAMISMFNIYAFRKIIRTFSVGLVLNFYLTLYESIVKMVKNKKTNNINICRCQLNEATLSSSAHFNQITS